MWNANFIHVTAEETLAREKIKIGFGVEMYNITQPDSDPMNAMKKYTLVFDGENKAPVINEYGVNDFLIIYDNAYFLHFNQFKTNCNHQHDYNFHFFKNADQLWVTVDINGEDDLKFDQPLLKIN
ncbi:MAG TPA: hypothetical protein VLB84_03715, partial [Bacteroidia bacterium]|nr:hypothetical protein [Bacteroidia bacterium]